MPGHSPDLHSRRCRAGTPRRCDRRASRDIAAPHRGWTSRAHAGGGPPKVWRVLQILNGWDIVENAADFADKRYGCAAHGRQRDRHRSYGDGHGLARILEQIGEPTFAGLPREPRSVGYVGRRHGWASLSQEVINRRWERWSAKRNVAALGNGRWPAARSTGATTPRIH